MTAMAMAIEVSVISDDYPEGRVGDARRADTFLRHVVETDLHQAAGGNHPENNTETGEDELEDLAIARRGRVGDEERNDAGGEERRAQDAEGADPPPSEVCFEHCEQHREIHDKNVGWHRNHLSSGDTSTVTFRAAGRIGPRVALRVESGLPDLHPGVEPWWDVGGHWSEAWPERGNDLGIRLGPPRPRQPALRHARAGGAP
jgi:hypothetical protein